MLDKIFLDKHGNPDPSKIAAHLCSLSKEDGAAFVEYLMAETSPRPTPIPAKDVRNLELAHALRQLPVEEIKDVLAIQGGGSLSRQMGAHMKQGVAEGFAAIMCYLLVWIIGGAFLLLAVIIVASLSPH